MGKIVTMKTDCSDLTRTDTSLLIQALTLAEIRRGFCAPNPSVGALIVRDNQILSTGYHYAHGCVHAEIDALKKLNNRAPGAALYVSLEPCCHYGKTPPCTDAIIASGIKRVIYGLRDPNSKVSGKGEAALKSAGIECHHLPLPQILDFYQSYSHWQHTQTPFITGKIALTLDGKIAQKDGQPIPITGSELREFTHLNRKKSDAILTTSKTIIQDNPQMNARLPNDTIAKPLYILDSLLNLPLTAHIFETAKSLTIFHSKEATLERISLFQNRGIRTIQVNSNAKGLDLHQISKIIGADGIHDLWLEAGGTCFSAFLKEQLFKKIYFYIAPKIQGEGVSAFNSQIEFSNSFVKWKQYGTDVICEITELTR